MTLADELLNELSPELQHRALSGQIKEDNLQPQIPCWIEEKSKGNELKNKEFCNYFIKKYKLKYINYNIYLGDVVTSDVSVKKMLFDELEPFLEVSAQKIKSLLDIICVQATTDPPPVKDNQLCFKNCTLTFRKEEHGLQLEQLDKQDVCLYRIPHHFNATAESPLKFLTFLNELFYPEDVLTVQQFLGYSLLPNTKAQKSLFIVGDGGEGKSRLTALMQNVLGDACCVSKIHKLSERFFGTVLENKLLFIDDDLKSEKFSDTETFKSLVTNEVEILAEPKGKAHYKIKPFAKFLVLGNMAVGSLYDKSEGFYRRIHIIRVKPKDPNRPHNPDIIGDIWHEEKEQILLWLVQGAFHLMNNNYILHESNKSKSEIAKLKNDDNSAVEWLNETNFIYGKDKVISSKKLKTAYDEWCEDNDIFKVSPQTFKKTCENFFKQKNVKYSENISQQGKRVRGFKCVTIA